jgi:PTH1 family peptidyl-tRNA hydrolase
MRLIVGLGNPEKDYKYTKHNTGFEVINKLAFDLKLPLSKSKFRSQIGEGMLFGEKIILAKPQTYMNNSGESIRDLMRYQNLSKENLIIIYDDINLPLGGIRIRKKGSAGGHNGMKNIIYHLETDEFIRVRVGIGLKPPEMILHDYVLSRFKKNEMESFIDGVTRAGDAILSILSEGVDAAMNKYNHNISN